MDYSSWCKAQMGMILGNNPKNVNFVVGMDSNSAKYPHHRAASGYQSFDEMKGKTTTAAMATRWSALWSAVRQIPTSLIPIL